MRDFYMEPTGITADVSALLEPAMRIRASTRSESLPAALRDVTAA